MISPISKKGKTAIVIDIAPALLLFMVFEFILWKTENKKEESLKKIRDILLISAAIEALLLFYLITTYIMIASMGVC